MAGAVWWLDDDAAGWSVIAFLVAFSLARGVCAVAMKDGQGKSIPKARHGRVPFDCGIRLVVARFVVVRLTCRRCLFRAQHRARRRAHRTQDLPC